MEEKKQMIEKSIFLPFIKGVRMVGKSEIQFGYILQEILNVDRTTSSYLDSNGKIVMIFEAK